MNPPRLDEMPDAMSPADVARVLPIGRNAVYAAIKDGSIPSVRIGRRLIVPKSALIRVLDPDNAKGVTPADATP